MKYGILGMGFQEASIFKVPSVIEALFASVRGFEKVFSFKLSRSDSELFIGGSNRKKFVGEPTWVPLTVPVCHVTLQSISLA
jgi:hypothetical protein